jgi:hypothetical protein
VNQEDPSVDAQKVSLFNRATSLASFLSDRLCQNSLCEFSLANSGTLGLPCAVVEILLLVEDKRFPTHLGVDFFGVLRALLANPRNNVLQGASTISQQIFTMRRFALTSTRPERTVRFKIHQVWWAIYQETLSCKVDILTEYVNKVYVGRSHWGLNQAAFGYFNMSMNEINPAQAFFLAERIGSPNSIRPGRLLNLMARVAIRDYFARYSIDEMSVIDVYRYVYGDNQRLDDLNRRRETAEETKSSHVIVSSGQLDAL